jgi:hypothetical protein
MRWFWGGILQFRYMPRIGIFRRIYSSLSWLCGFFTTLLLPIGLICRFIFNINIFSQHLFLVGGLSLCGIIWLFRYQFGLYKNLTVSPIGAIHKLILHLALIPASFLVELLCTIPTVLALIVRPGAFEITVKYQNEVPTSQNTISRKCIARNTTSVKTLSQETTFNDHS